MVYETYFLYHLKQNPLSETKFLNQNTLSQTEFLISSVLYFSKKKRIVEVMDDGKRITYLWSIIVCGLLSFVVYYCLWSIIVCGLLLFVVYYCLWSISVPMLQKYLLKAFAMYH